MTGSRRDKGLGNKEKDPVRTDVDQEEKLRRNPFTFISVKSLVLFCQVFCQVDVLNRDTDCIPFTE